MSQNSAKIVGEKIVLSLPNATTPVVWQMDLNAAQSASFTVQEDKKKKTFNLVLKKDDGAIEDIAPFDTKDTAVAVLMDTADALQNANNNIPEIAVGAAMQSSANSDKKNDRIGALLAFALVIVLFGIWLISASNNPPLQEIAQGSETSIAAGTSESGVAVSADDFLNQR